MAEAVLYTARSIQELSQLILSLAQEGYHIVSVIDTQNGDYHVIGQKEKVKCPYGMIGENGCGGYCTMPGVKAERERCAKIADAHDYSIQSSTEADLRARQIAAAIRKDDGQK